MKLNLIIILGILILIMGIGSASAENPYLDPMVTDCELVAEKTFNNFTATWYYSPGLVSQEYIIAVQNLEDINRETNISGLFSETNFNIKLLSNIKFSEYKLVPYTYDLIHYDEIEHSEWNETNQSWNNWTEQLYNYTEEVESEKLEWKACKMNTFSQGVNNWKEDYGNILIPKYNSKDKGDSTFNGTKIFRFTFDTPITNSDSGFGSTGRLALFLDDIEFCPWWNASWLNRKAITVTTNGTSMPVSYQIEVNVTYESEMQVDFDDLRFTNSSGGELSYWLESKVNSDYAFIWVNLTDAITDPGSDTIYMYYGNGSASSLSDGDATFLQYDQFDDLNDWSVEPTKGALALSGTHTRHGSNAAYDNGGMPWMGHTGTIDNAEYSIWFWMTTGTTASGVIQLATTNPAVGSPIIGVMSDHFPSYYVYTYPGWTSTGIARTEGWHKVTGTYNGTYFDFYFDDTFLASQTYTAPAKMVIGDPWGRTIPAWWDEYIVKTFIDDIPVLSYGSEEYPVDSLHYNASAPYNHTIETGGVVTANRSVVAGDDTNDTAVSTGTSHLVLNVFDNGADIVRNFTFTGDDLDWYQAANLSAGTYQLKNSSGIIESQTNGNFTINLVAGTYWIEVLPPDPYTPPDPVSLSSTVFSDNYTVIWTWAAGSGNITDSYNVSVNGSWTNGSANTSYTHALGGYGTSTIEVWAYNSSASGTLSDGSVSGSQEVKEIIPLLFNIFLLLAILTLILTGYSVLYEDLTNFTHIICGFLAGVLWIILGYQAYIGIAFEHITKESTYSNGSLVSSVEVVEISSHQYGWLGLLFVLIGIIMILYSIIQAYNANKDIIEEFEEKDKSDEYRSE